MSHLDAFIAQYGFIALLIGAMFEGETVAVTGGVLAHRNLINLEVVIVAVGAGAWLSDQMFFWLGRRFGQSGFVKRKLDHGALARVLQIIRGRPYFVAAVFRFLPGFRIATPMMLAQAGVSYLPYALITLLSAAVWAVVYATVGHGVGVLMATLLGHIHRTELILLAAALAVVAIVVHRLLRTGGPS